MHTWVLSNYPLYLKVNLFLKSEVDPFFGRGITKTVFCISNYELIMKNMKTIT